MVHIIIYSAEAASPPPPPPVYMLVIEFEEVNFLPDTNLRRVPFGHALGHTLSQSVSHCPSNSPALGWRFGDQKINDDDTGSNVQCNKTRLD